jgi:hypothetical protein
MANDNEQVEVSTDEARGGATPGVTRYVLGASLVLVVAIFAAILLWGRL